MDGPPRIIEIISGFGVESPLGGVERFTLDLSFHLVDMGIPLSVYGFWEHGTPFEAQWMHKLREKGAATYIGHPWDPAHPYQSFWRAYTIMRDTLSGQTFDVIHCHGQFCDVAGIFLKGINRQCSLIRTIHHEYEWRKRPVRRAVLTQWVYPVLFDKEIGVSQAVVAELDQRAAASLLRKQAEYIPNGINLERFKLAPLQVMDKLADLHIPLDAFVIGSVGRMSPEKGYADLLQAFHGVINEIPSAVLVLVGDGLFKQALIEMAREINLGDKVHFLGPRKDVAELLPLFDIFISSSHWEAMPTVLLESMAAQVPIIATRTTGAEALIKDQISGWLVPTRDPESLAKAILKAYCQPHLRRECAKQAYQDVQAYSMGVVAQQHISLYSSLKMRKHGQIP